MALRSLRKEFGVAIGACEAAIRINTDEIDDALNTIAEVARKYGWELRVWDHILGLVWYNGEPHPKQSDTPAAKKAGTGGMADSLNAPPPFGQMQGPPNPLAEVVKFLQEPSAPDASSPGEVRPVILAMKNFNLIFGEDRGRAVAAIQHIVADKVQDHPEYGRKKEGEQSKFRKLMEQHGISGDSDTGKFLVGLMPPGAKLPPEVAPLFRVIDHELPDAEELGVILDGIIPEGKDGQPLAGKETKKKAAKHAVGLTRLQAEGVFSAVTVQHGAEADFETVLPKFVWEHKSEILNKEGLVTLYGGGETFDDVVGLGGVKRLLRDLLAPDDDDPEDPELRSKGMALVGPPRCLHADTPVFDPVDGTSFTVFERWQAAKPFHVLARDRRGATVVAQAERPWRYRVAPMVETVFASGRRITTTTGHRFWTTAGWLSAGEVSSRLQAGAHVLLPTTTEYAQTTRTAGARRSTRTAEDCQDCCSPGYGLRDALLHREATDARGVLPSRDGARRRNRPSSRTGDPVGARTSSGRHAFAPLCKPSHARRTGPCSGHEFRGRSGEEVPALFGGCTTTRVHTPLPTHRSRTRPAAAELARAAKPVFGPGCGSRVACAGPRTRHPESNRTGLPVRSVRCRRCTLPAISASPSRYSFSTGWSDEGSLTDEVVAVNVKGEDHYYDFHVPVHENYWACGILHHNTGKSLIAKAAGNTLNVPTLMVDVGSWFGGLVGDTEKNTRKGFQIIRAHAPCIAVIDEVEKVMPSAKGGDHDSGVSRRMAGTFMTQLQDIQEPVFWVFTANGVEDLHEAFLADDRVDAVVYVHLPGEEARAACWKMYIGRFFPAKKKSGQVNPRHLETDPGVVIAELRKAKKVNPVEWANRVVAAMLCTWGEQRDSCMQQLKAADGNVYATVGKFMIDDGGWTPARVKSVCRLARKRKLSLSEVARMMPRSQKNLQRAINRLERWASDEAVDAETGFAYVAAEEREADEEAPRVKAEGKTKVRRKVRKLGESD
jgi:hypothetical protein